MNYTVINLNDALKANRIDAEFFQSEFIELDEKLTQGSPLHTIATTCDLQSNGAFKTIFAILNDGKPKTVPYIRSENVGDFFIRKDDLNFISKDAHLKLKKTQTKSGDI